MYKLKLARNHLPSTFLPQYRSFSASHHHKPARLHHMAIPSKNKDSPDLVNLVVLHGLLGSSSNFQSILKNHKISSQANTFLLDLRNHGASEHKDTMTFPEMSHDVYHFIQENNLQSNLVLLAHSFGARIGMNFAMQYPEVLKGIIIVDMAPYNYHADQRFGFTKITHKMLQNLLEIDLNLGYDKVIEAVKLAVPTQDTLGLIVRNLESNDKGEVKWKVNLKTIFENYLDMQKTVPQPGHKGKYNGPIKIICGEKSDYVSQDILVNFHNIFDGLDMSKDVEIVKDAGHWLHHQKPHEFINIVANFLQSIKK